MPDPKFIPELRMPIGLSPSGFLAHESIVDFLQAKGLTNTGGCRAFYSPQEWAERGEEYGKRSILVVVYDGGDLRPAFNMDAAYDADCALVQEFGRPEGYQPYALLEAMQAELKKLGFYFEECTRWYGAVYPIEAR
jgi:hypothetical protein